MVWHGAVCVWQLEVSEPLVATKSKCPAAPAGRATAKHAPPRQASTDAASSSLRVDLTSPPVQGLEGRETKRGRGAPAGSGQVPRPEDTDGSRGDGGCAGQAAANSAPGQLTCGMGPGQSSAEAGPSPLSSQARPAPRRRRDSAATAAAAARSAAGSTKTCHDERSARARSGVVTSAGSPRAKTRRTREPTGRAEVPGTPSV